MIWKGMKLEKQKYPKTNIDQSKKKDHNYKKKIEGHLWIFTYIT